MNSAILVLIFAIHCISLYLFQSGFLLTRTVVERPGKPDLDAVVREHVPTIPTKLELHNTQQMIEEPYKVLIILIDALRFDFASVQPNSTLPYHNHMQSIADKLRDSPRNSLLFHFVADPPTTTMQRLKALMTGSLPTFVDVGSSFSSGKVMDDHLLRRLQAGGKKLVFMGDDTWLSLYEDELFYASYPYPSFEVFDLHTVDEGCLDTIKKYVDFGTNDVVHQDWDMLVAHFLGVDHAGHRYGPNHYEMEKKLKQLNRFLEKLFDSIDDRTIAFVIGDHGMDGKGDHGGDSPAEMDSTCFIYSKKELLQAGIYSDAQVMQPSTGSGVYEGQTLWGTFSRSASARNSGQYNFEAIKNTHYPAIFQIDIVPTIAELLGIDIPFGSLGMAIPQIFIRNDCLHSKCVNSDMKALRRYLTVLNDSLKSFYSFVVVYSEHTGVLTELSAHFAALREEVNAKWDLIDTEEIVACSEKINGCSEEQVASVVDAMTTVMKSIREALDKCRNVWARFDMLMIYLGLLSGVFGVLLLLVFIRLFIEPLTERAKRHAFIVIGLSFLYSGIFTTNSFIIFEDSVVFYLLQTLTLMMFVMSPRTKMKDFGCLMALVVARFTFSSTVCREEQLPRCQPTFYDFALILPETLFGGDVDSRTFSVPTKAIAVLLVIVLIMPSLIQYLALSQYKSKEYFKLRRLNIVFLLVLLHWIFEALEERINPVSPEYGPKIIRAKVWSARLAFGFVFLAIVKDMIQYRFIKGDLLALGQLVNVYLIVSITQLPPGFWMLTLGLAQFLFISFAFKNPSLLQVLLVLLIGKHQFFATGHQVTFSSIQFQTGFIALDEFHFVLSGGLVVVNYIGPWVVFMVGQLILLRKIKSQSQAEYDVALLLILAFHTTTVVSSLIFTAHFRRHLMVWNVFAPRFMLAGVELLLNDISLFAFNVFS